MRAVSEAVVRLRNSWGAHWGDAGYITSSAENFLRWQQNASAGMRGQILLTWIGDEPASPVPSAVAGKMVRIEDDISVFTGSMKDQLQFVREGFVHHYGYVTGTRVFFDGRTDGYRAGRGIMR